MYQIAKDFWFSAAHRLTTSDAGACGNLHGHNYKVQLSILAPDVDKNGYVVNFHALDEIEEWIMRNFDHKCLLLKSDPLAKVLEGHTPLFLCESFPTAEYIAELIRQQLSQRFPNAVVSPVRVWETHYCSALSDGIAGPATKQTKETIN